MSDVAVVIMAGGEGRRLRPYTYYCPKPLVKVSGRPLLEYSLELAESSKFSEVYVIGNYLGYQIKKYLVDSYSCAKYLHEDEFLGTAGILRKFYDFDNVIVINADVISDISLDDLYAHHVELLSDVTVATKDYTTEIPYAVVNTEEGYIKKIREKPTYMNRIATGIYVLSQKALGIGICHQGKSRIDMPEVIKRCVGASLPVVVYPIKGTWIEVGNPESLLLAEKICR